MNTQTIDEPALTSVAAESLLTQVRSFCFPNGDEPFHGVRAVRTKQRGAMRMSPEAPWINFTAEEEIDCRHSGFHWEAHYSDPKMGSVSIIDSYSHCRGRVIISSMGGLIPVKKIAGPMVDQGELQRYLASVFVCPPILLNNDTLDWSSAGPLSLRVRDRFTTAGASVVLDFAEDGRPLLCRADRPRMVGANPIVTGWVGACKEYREWDGLRAAAHLEASWALPQCLFTYYTSEITSFELLR